MAAHPLRRRLLPHGGVHGNKTGCRVLASTASAARHRRSAGVSDAASPRLARPAETANPASTMGHATCRTPADVAFDATLRVSQRVAAVCRRVCALTSTSRASAPSSATMRWSCRADRRPQRPSHGAGSPRRAAGCRARSVSQHRSRLRVGRQRDGARPLPLAGAHVHGAGALGGGHVVDDARRPRPAAARSRRAARAAPGPGSSRSGGRRAAAGGPRPRPGRGERAPAGRPGPRPAPPRPRHSASATSAARETFTVAGAALATVGRQARRSRAAAGQRRRSPPAGHPLRKPRRRRASPGTGRPARRKDPGAGGHAAGGQPAGELLGHCGRCGRCGRRRRRVGGRRVCRGQAHPRSASSSAPAEASPLTASWALRSAWVGCAGSRCARVS